MSGVSIIVAQLLADAAVHQLAQDRVLPHQAHEATALPLLSVFGISREQRDPVSLAHSVARVTERVQVDAVVSRDAPQTLPALVDAVHKACANRIIAAHGAVSDVVIRPAGRGPQMPDEERQLIAQPIDFLVSFNEPTAR